MKKKLYITLCIIILTLFVISYSVKGTTVNEVLEQKKDELNNKIDNTTNEIGNFQGQIDNVSTEIQEINEKVAKYQQEINDLNAKSLQLEVNIENAQKELQTAEETYEQQKKLFEKRIVAIYEAGETVYLEVLLNSKTIEQFISSYYYLSEISKYDKDLIENILQNKEKIENKKNNLLVQQNQLKAITSNKERTAVTLKNTQAVRTSYLNQLTEKQLKEQQKLEIYEKEMEELEKQILEISFTSMNEDYVGGDFAWPVPGYYTITSPFGMRIHPVLHVLRLHTGTDIGAPEGVNIIAANSGVVTVATYSASYGNYVMIDHGGGVVTLYGHASELCVSVGDIVKAGDVIAKVGRTGWSTGFHLHFEIRINGNVVDPLPYITKTNSDKNNENNLNNNMISDITNNVN